MFKSNAQYYVKETISSTAGVGATFKISTDFELGLNLETGADNTSVKLVNGTQIERMTITATGGVATIVQRGLTQADTKVEDTNLRKTWTDGTIMTIVALASDMLDIDKSSGVQTFKSDIRIDDNKKIYIGNNAYLTTNNNGDDLILKDGNNSETKLSEITAGTGTDHKLKVSATDTTAGFLNGKLSVGDGLTKTIINPGVNESIDLDIDLNYLNQNINPVSVLIAGEDISQTDIDNSNNAVCFISDGIDTVDLLLSNSQVTIGGGLTSDLCNFNIDTIYSNTALPTSISVNMRALNPYTSSGRIVITDNSNNILYSSDTQSYFGTAQNTTFTFPTPINLLSGNYKFRFQNVDVRPTYFNSTSSILTIPLVKTRNGNKVYKTNADNILRTNFIGFAMNAVLAGGNVNISYTRDGVIPGVQYYLINTPGAIGTSPGTNIVSIGTATSTTAIGPNTSGLSDLYISDVISTINSYTRDYISTNISSPLLIDKEKWCIFSLYVKGFAGATSIGKVQYSTNNIDWVDLIILSSEAPTEKTITVPLCKGYYYRSVSQCTGEAINVVYAGVSMQNYFSR